MRTAPTNLDCRQTKVSYLYRVVVGQKYIYVKTVKDLQARETPDGRVKAYLTGTSILMVN